MKILVNKMENDSFLKSLFHGKSPRTPKKVVNVFKKIFPDAINVEWHQKNGLFEAIFYQNDIEKITEFDPDGNCLMIKTNLWPETFAGEQRLIAENYGEIMNIIKIEKNGEIIFEFIVRDKELIRYLMIIDNNGRKIRFEKL